VARPAGCASESDRAGKGRVSSSAEFAEKRISTRALPAAGFESVKLTGTVGSTFVAGTLAVLTREGDAPPPPLFPESERTPPTRPAVSAAPQPASTTASAAATAPQTTSPLRTVRAEPFIPPPT